jgi:hypothetical protein
MRTVWEQFLARAKRGGKRKCGLVKVAIERPSRAQRVNWAFPHGLRSVCGILSLPEY